MPGNILPLDRILTLLYLLFFVEESVTAFLLSQCRHPLLSRHYYFIASALSGNL